MTENGMQVEALKNLVVEILAGMKGHDINVIDVRQLTDVTDYMIIASGTSDRHVKSMAHQLRDQLREQTGVRPVGVEGDHEGDWVLVDLVDVVVHIMRPQTRQYYDLERLWNRDVEELVRMNRETKE